MERTFVLEIISPEGTLFGDPVAEVTLPAENGEITILPDHAPLFTKVAEGEIAIRRGGESTYITVAGGFLEVSANKVTILADFAIESDDIIVQKVEEAKKAAEEALKNKQSQREAMAVTRDLRRSLLELKVYDKLQKRKKKTV